MSKSISKQRKPVKTIAKNTTEDEPNKRKYIVPVILAAAQLIASTALIISVRRLNLLQTWQLLLTSITLLSLEVLTIWKLIASKKTKKASKIIVIIISIVVSSVAIIGYRYVRQTVSFIESITGAHYETQTYKVLVLKSSQYNDIKQLNTQHIGFLTQNPNAENTKSTLKNVINFKDQNYDELGGLIAGISDFKVSAITLTDSYLEFLEENNNDFIEKSKVIYQFEVRIDKEKDVKRVNVATEPFILYISGSDSRIGLNDTARSDVNIVAVVNPKKAKILLVSIPRDYYVQLHGTTGAKDKLTHAGIYGTEMSKNTIADLLGIEINYTLKVGFSTVINVVDKVGGLDIDSDQDFTAWTNKSCHFTKGAQHVDSSCALAFSRERYAYATGDRHRGQNQQQVITKLIEKISNPHYLIRWADIMQAAEGSFETNLSYDEITDFARYQLSELKNWTTESISLDGSGAMLPTYSMGKQKLYVMLPYQETIDTAKTKIAECLD